MGEKRKAASKLTIDNATELMAYLQPSFALPERPVPGADLQARLDWIKEEAQQIEKIFLILSKTPPKEWGTYRDPLTGDRTYFNGRIANSKVEEAKNRLNNLFHATDSLLKSQLSLAATTIEPGTGDRRGDGNCYIQTVNIGQGDCTTITTPEGKLILADMGSDSSTDIKLDWESCPADGTNTSAQTDPILLSTLRRPIFLGTNNLIHLLILSHTDGDHHNKLKALGNEMQFGRVYYSGDAITDYVGSTYYTTSAYIQERTPGGENSIKKVDLKPKKDSADITKQINGQTPLTRATSAQPGGFDSEYVDSTTGAIVLYQEASGFKISVLASNVVGVNTEVNWMSNDADIKTSPKESRLKLDATVPNKRSLVFLVEFNGMKAIITGDATAVTEYFMASQVAYAPLFKDVTMYRLPHHASPTSSSIAIVSKLTNLSDAVASSSGKCTRLHRLPKDDILKLYDSKPGDLHQIWAFDNAESGPKDQIEFNKKTYATGSNGTGFFKFPKP